MYPQEKSPLDFYQPRSGMVIRVGILGLLGPVEPLLAFLKEFQASQVELFSEFSSFSELLRFSELFRFSEFFRLSVSYSVLMFLLSSILLKALAYFSRGW